MGQDNDGSASNGDQITPFELLESSLFKERVERIVSDELSREEAEGAFIQKLDRAAKSAPPDGQTDNSFQKFVDDRIDDKLSLKNIVTSWKFWSLFGPLVGALAFLGIDRSLIEDEYAQPVVHWMIDTDARIENHPTIEELSQLADDTKLGRQSLIITERFTLNEEMQLVLGSKSSLPDCAELSQNTSAELVPLEDNFDHSVCFDIDAKRTEVDVPIWVDVRRRTIDDISVSAYVRPLGLRVECVRNGQRGKFLERGIPCFEFSDDVAISKDDLSVSLNAAAGSVEKSPSIRGFGDGAETATWHKYDIEFPTLDLENLNEDSLNRFPIRLAAADAPIVANVVFVVELELSRPSSN